jgi:hypothetical protein
MRVATLILAAGLSLLAASTAGANTYRLTSTDVAPGATGEIQTSEDRNGNIEVELRVEHLANPATLRVASNTYVVWFRETGRQALNQGQLRVDDDLKGQLRTTTSLRQFELFVTAENDAAVVQPSNVVVLRATIQE